MTARMLASLALALGLTLSGCSGTPGGTKDTDTTADGDDDDDDTVINTAETGDDDDDDDDTSPYFDARILRYEAQFGYDQATGTVRTVGGPYGDITPSLDLYLGLPEWEQASFDFYATDLYCYVSLDLTGGIDNPSWATALPYAYYGVEYNGGAISSDCTSADGKELDPYFWGTPDTLVSYYGPWGAAAGDFSEPAGQFFNDYYPQYYTDDTFFGGALTIGLVSSVKANGLDENCYGFANQVDANFDLVESGGYLIPLDKTTLTAGGNLGSAWFRVYSLLTWTFY